MGIALQVLLHQQSQALHALPHIGVTHRQPHPRARRDHRSAFTTAVTSVGVAPAKMLTRPPFTTSTTIAGRCSSGWPTSSSTTTASVRDGSGTCSHSLRATCRSAASKRHAAAPPASHRSRRKRLLQNLAPFRLVPPPPTFGACEQRDLTHQLLLSALIRARLRPLVHHPNKARHAGWILKMHPTGQKRKQADRRRQHPMPPTSQDREHVRQAEGLAAHRAQFDRYAHTVFSAICIAAAVAFRLNQ